MKLLLVYCFSCCLVASLTEMLDYFAALAAESQKLLMFGDFNLSTSDIMEFVASMVIKSLAAQHILATMC